MSTIANAFVLAGAVITIESGSIATAAPAVEGIWEPAPSGGQAHPPLAEVRLTPEGQAAYESFSTDENPIVQCITPGVPLGILDPYPLEIIQQDHQIVFLYEHFHMVRRIFMDGRQAPADWWPSLVGYSVGSWEENTLVVKTTHLSPANLMRMNGLPFSGDPESHAIERYTFDGDEVTLIAEVFDSRYYDEPYVMRGRRMLAPDGVILEYECFTDFNGIG